MKTALKLALEALEVCEQHGYIPVRSTRESITAIKEALAQEKALQTLHDENERLGLYKDAYAQPEQEPVGYFNANSDGKWEQSDSNDGVPFYAALPPQPKEPEQEQKLYLPAANEAVEILKALGYVYEQTDAGLAWVAKEPEKVPVAHLWQHGKTGRNRIVMQDQIITADANWIVVGPLFLHTTPPPVAEPHKRKPLDMTEIVRLTYDIDEDKPATMAELFRFARAIEAAHGIKE